MNTPNPRKQLFDQFISGGFGDINNIEKNSKEAQAHIEHIASTYKWNYNSLFPTIKDAKILDLGCGMGQCLYWLEQQGYTNIRGVDVSAEMVEFCRTQVNTNVEQIESIDQFLGGVENEYDVIVMNDVIEHLEKQTIVPSIALLKKALKPGGLLVIKTNNVSALTGARMRFEDFTHETSFTEYSLRQVLRIGGFSNISLHPFEMPRTSLTRWARYILQCIQHAMWKYAYFLEFTTVPKIVNEFFFAVARKEK